MFFCPGLGVLNAQSWLALPLLFIGCTVGVTGLLTDAFADNDVTVSVPLLLGAATALSVLTSGCVAWRSTRSRRRALTVYPPLLMLCSLGGDELRLPLATALSIGSIAAIGVFLVLFRAARVRRALERRASPPGSRATSTMRMETT